MAQGIHEVVGVFDDPEALERAVFTLETRGFDRAAFSVLASEQTVEKTLGHRYRQVSEMEDDPDAPRETFFGHVSRLEAELFPAPVLAGLGWLALAGMGTGIAAVIAAGAGGLIGAGLGGLIHHHHAARLQEQVERGGVVLWVGVRDDEREALARAVLAAEGAHDIHTHVLAV
ncbi:hypothetical protein [Acidocella sp.]|uniref:hypothetical protein n=1 Tax=Acidocella sp. TaxID=50710 RepID=UPI002638C7A1|nr:hypothetical protein [Acidocella sp.]